MVAFWDNPMKQYEDWYLSRFKFEFEFHVPHQILYTTSATDEKSHFHISYQNWRFSWQKIDMFEENKGFFKYFFSKIKVGFLV